MKFSCLIIGLGKVGMMYDFHNPTFRTHLSTIQKLNNFYIKGAVDTSPYKRKKFEKKFNKPSFSNLVKAVTKLNPSILIIAVDIESVSKVYETIIKNNLKFKAIIFEKPVANKIQTAKKIFKYCNKNKIYVFVNYMRRFDKSIEKIKNMIDENKLGLIKKINVNYKKGFVNSCSHYINFLDYLNFINKKIKVFKIIRFAKNDNQINFVIKKSFNVNFNYYKKNSIDEKIIIYGEFLTIEYLTEKGIIKVKSKYQNKFIKNNYSQPFKSVYENIRSVLLFKKNPKSSINDSLRTLEIINIVLSKKHKKN